MSSMRTHAFLAIPLALFFFLPLLTSAASCPNLTRNLSFGSRGQDVVQLQNFLIAQNDLAAGNNTGYFGNLTRTAVRKFQCREMSICSGSEATNGYGSVGPRTRAAIKSVCSAQASVPATTVPSVPPVTYTPPPTPTFSACVPLPAQTQTIACPTGQTGSITQTRTSSCSAGSSSPTWGEWRTMGNSCTGSGPTALSGTFDSVTWMNTTKGAGNVKTYGELWNDTTQAWVRNGGPANPMKMSADLTNNHIYFHKDSSWQDFVGQTYNFDSTYVRARTETVGNFNCTDVNPPGGRCDVPGTWDARNDKFRLFVDQANSRHGYLLAPRPAQNGWSSSLNTFDTYYCNSFSELHTNTCTLYQKGVQMYVTVNFYSNYDIFNADGDVVAMTPSGTPQKRIFDVMVVTIEDGACMVNATPGTARCNGRERNFYGRIGDEYWGFVRFDDALRVNGQYKLKTRAVAYEWDTTYNPSFNDLKTRALEDDSADFTPTAPKVPYDLKATCAADGRQATFSWSGVADATSYWLRADDTSNQAAACTTPTITGPGSRCVDPTDYVNDNVTSPTTVTISPNKQISWWVHALTSTGPSSATVGVTFTCVPQ